MDFDILGRNITDKAGNQTCFAMPPQVTCASALPCKTGKRENHIFTQLDCVTHAHNEPVRCLPGRKGCHM